MAEIHFIECAGKILGRRCTWFAERDCDATGFSATVDDILKGQVENVRRVYRGRTEDNWFEDVSEEVAIEILNRLDHAPEGEVMDFLEEHLGCERVANFERELEGVA